MEFVLFSSGSDEQQATWSEAGVQSVSALAASCKRAAGSVSLRLPAFLAISRRTHACDPSSLPRTIHKFDSANSVKSWAVFFFKPR